MMSDVKSQKNSKNLLSVFDKLSKWSHKILFKDQDVDQDADGQIYWKNKLFYFIAIFLLTFGAPLALFSAYMFYFNEGAAQAVVVIFAYVMLSIAIILKSLSLTRRKLLVVLNLYIISLNVLIYAGNLGAGMVCVLFTLILAGCLLEKRQIIQFVVINLMFFIGLTILLMNGSFDGVAIKSYEQAWYINAITTQFFGIGLLVLMNTIFNGLENQTRIIRKSEEKYKLITENAFDVISVYNFKKCLFTYVSPSVLYLTGFTPDEVMAQSLSDTLSPESLAEVSRDMGKSIHNLSENPQNFHHFITDVQQICKNGNLVWVEVSTKLRYNFEGEIEAVCVNRNIEERKKAEKQMLYLSYYDQLTGLYNRRFYEEELKRLDAKRNYPIALVMFDVNGLKLTNEAFGHKVGDTLLQTVARIIKCQCRQDEIIARLSEEEIVAKSEEEKVDARPNENDIIARIGGDEFVILMPKTDANGASRFIERVNEAILNEKMENLVLSISIGFAIKCDGSEDFDEIFKQAEDDMNKHKLSESSSMRSKTIELIMNSLYEKSIREMKHSKRVSEICETIATHMNLEKNTISRLKIAGLMHDIGKIGIKETILNKVGKLDDEEREEIKKHSEIGYRILSSANEFSEIAEYVLEHQERWDGKGYPKGLKGDQISLEARIIAVADAYDAMTSDRAYRKGLSEEDAMTELRRCAGTQFDPTIADFFIEKVMGK